MTTAKQIKQHEDKYWHILKLVLLPLLGVIIFSLLAYKNYLLIDKQIINSAFLCSENCNKLVVHDLLNLYSIIVEYILIVLALISLVAMFKKGYTNLKTFKERGLIYVLIIGLIIGLISISVLIYGLIIGLISVLISVLIIGLIIGLSEEFR